VRVAAGVVLARREAGRRSGAEQSACVEPRHGPRVDDGPGRQAQAVDVRSVRSSVRYLGEEAGGRVARHGRAGRPERERSWRAEGAGVDLERHDTVGGRRRAADEQALRSRARGAHGVQPGRPVERVRSDHFHAVATGDDAVAGSARRGVGGARRRAGRAGYLQVAALGVATGVGEFTDLVTAQAPLVARHHAVEAPQARQGADAGHCDADRVTERTVHPDQQQRHRIAVQRGVRVGCGEHAVPAVQASRRTHPFSTRYGNRRVTRRCHDGAARGRGRGRGVQHAGRARRLGEQCNQTSHRAGSQWPELGPRLDL
jgi:hypothetical protein